MGVRIADLLTMQATESFFGRDAYLASLERLLDDDGPLVMYLHGIGGVGKSRLLDAFTSRAGARGAVVVRLDGRSIEPTERGFISELGYAIGVPTPATAAVARALGALAGRVLLVVDHYELLRLLDAWLRQVFIPMLADHTRVLLASREPPVSAWFVTPGWQNLFRSLLLEPLGEPDALALLRHAGLDEPRARRINRFARGHPLTLKLAAAAAHERPDLDVEAAATQPMIDLLARLYLTGIDDPITRQTLQAASVVRRATQPVLQSMLPNLPSHEAYERLRALPFVELARDGLIVHDVVREAVAADLKASDPALYQQYRRAAWHALHSASHGAGGEQSWRYTADMLYLLETPLVREVFFPCGSASLAVEPARPGDLPDLLAISAHHDGPAAARLIEHWWLRQPGAFYVVRDRDNAVAGFSCLFLASEVNAVDLQIDPLARAWYEHLQRSPVAAHEKVLLLRCVLSRDHGERFSPEVAALNLDIKRAYMNLRPNLRRLYTFYRDPLPYQPALQRLGFQLLPGLNTQIGDLAHHVALLDFGPGSVDGWLTNLVASELGSREHCPVVLDSDARELVIEGQRIGLSNLEFAVMHYLVNREGKAVSRVELLDEVWGYSYDGGSNVVDVVVRSLRKKLGSYAPLIETVTKVGYRYRPPGALATT